VSRVRVSSGSPLEPTIGFSRAVRVGKLMVVAGTAPIGDDGRVVAPGDVRGQTRRCFDIAEAALRDAGLSFEHVVRTRVMLLDIGRWQEAAQIHGEIFHRIRPACTFVQIGRFIDPAWLVEIELVAYAN